MKKVILIITFLLAYPIYANSQSKNGEFNEKSAIITDSGKFAIVQKGDHGQQILLDGKNIGVENYLLSFKNYFQFEVGEVILVEIVTGGSGCPYGYIFISCCKDGKIYASEEFGNCALPNIITESNETIAIYFRKTRRDPTYRVQYKNCTILENSKLVKQRAVK